MAVPTAKDVDERVELGLQLVEGVHHVARHCAPCPETTHPSRRRTPTAIGEAIAALAQHERLHDAWRAADGTAIDATRLR